MRDPRAKVLINTTLVKVMLAKHGDRNAQETSPKNRPPAPPEDRSPASSETSAPKQREEATA